MKCDGLGGQWVMDGTYKRSTGVGTAKGKERWTVTIDEATLQGSYTYRDDQVTQTGAVTVYVTGKANGDATLTKHDDGKVEMRLKDTKHTFSATTDKGGHGNDTPAALQLNIIIWEPGADC